MTWGPPFHTSRVHCCMGEEGDRSPKTQLDTSTSLHRNPPYTSHHSPSTGAVLEGERGGRGGERGEGEGRYGGGGGGEGAAGTGYVTWSPQCPRPLSVTVSRSVSESGSVSLRGHWVDDSRSRGQSGQSQSQGSHRVRAVRVRAVRESGQSKGSQSRGTGQ